MIRPKTTTNIYSTSGYNIIIVGAGIAGITAAHQLVARGFNVLILEARSRIGGRIDTIFLAEHITAERGCQFIHGPGGNPLSPLLRRFHIDLQPISREKTILYDQAGKPVDIESADIQAILKKKSEALSKRRVSQATEYIHDGHSENKTGARALVEQIRETTVYMPFRKESLLAYKLGYTEEFSGGNYIITNGFKHLVDGLFTEASAMGTVEIQLNKVVKEIKHHGRKITVKTIANETFEADALICAVPLGVLKQNEIKFEPEFPKPKKVALENLGMAVMEKTILEFDQAFWPNDVHYLNPYDINADIWREIVNLNYFTNGKTATLLISNHVSEPKILNKPDKEIVHDATELLKGIFGNKITKLKNSYVTRWYQDPFSYGSYSYHLKNGTSYDNALLAEPYGRICFAGEHTSVFPSSVHGAYLSGIQAAEEIHSLLYHLGA